MKPSGQFVELNRRFADLGVADDSEELALRSYVGRSFGVASDIGWSDIFREGKSCVILGEAGSGKSREMEYQSQNLRATNRAAAYIDLRELLGDLSVLDSDPVLRVWRRSNDIAWFLLDSVDEAKITRVSDFHCALKRISQWVGSDSSRARYVVSSRISEWRPATDKRLVEDTLLAQDRILRVAASTEQSVLSKLFNKREGIGSRLHVDAEQAKATASELRVLSLLPLNKEQASAYLAGRGSVDERFFAEVDDADAWDFVRRPLDVSNLYALWQKQRRLGSLRSVIEHSITELLSDPKHALSISSDKLREGAEHVAACLTFAKSVTALLPDVVLPDATDALHFRSCLPRTWPDTDVALLAQCPIFDAAAYGKIRFHHRSYQTYLTASWLVRLMRTDCPYSELRHLLFREGMSKATLRPSLEAVAVWLACLDVDNASWQKMLRADLLESAPWLYFAHGDPTALPVQYKVQVLLQTAQNFKGRDHVRISWDRETLKRFADSGLAPDLARMIIDASLASDLRADYLELLQYGKLKEALPAAVAVAIDASAHEHLRATALRCIADIGSLEHRHEVLAGFEASAQISVRLGAQLVRVIYPEIVEERGLFAWLRRFAVPDVRARPSSLDVLDYFMEREVATDRVTPLLEQLCAFLLDDESKPRQDHAWAGEWLAPLTVRVLQATWNEVHVRKIVIEACTLIEILRELGWIDSWRIEDDFRALAEATQKHAELRREWFLRKVEKFQAARGTKPHTILGLDDYYAPLSLSPCDLNWLTGDIRAACSLVDRQFALRSALDICTTKTGKRPLLPPATLVCAAIGTSGLRGSLVKYLRTTISIYWQKFLNWILRRSKSGWWRQRLFPLLKAYWVIRNRWSLWRRRTDLERGDWLGGIWFVIDKSRVDKPISRWGSHDVTKPMGRYGKKVVEAAMTGADRYWRKHQPPLPFEKPAHNQTSTGTILGLVALQRAWEMHGATYFHFLSGSEAEAAARYAFDELNGFPEWFGELVSVHQQIVSGVVAQALIGEWHSTPPDYSFSSPTFRRLVQAPENVADLAMPTLQSLLQGPSPKNVHLLRDALRLVLRQSKLSRAWLAKVVMTKIDVVNFIGESDWPWLICLFLTDAENGLRILNRHFESLDMQQRKATAESLCARMHDDFHIGLSCADPDFERAAFLRSFIPWVYQYVRPIDDVVHEGVYSPDIRDHAEQFRRSLLGRLEALGDEADAILCELADDQNLADARDFVLYHIDRRASVRADEYSIAPKDLEALLAHHEREPRNREDLFHVAKSRLASFKEKVESAEVSIRRECSEDWLESDFQDWLQRHMQKEARGRYTIASEAKVDPGKFPDLRFEAPHVDGAVSVEAKVATFEHWSYPSLEERLRNQLIGQYLRAQNARYGFYVLIRENADRHWQDRNGGCLDWPALLIRLQDIANEIVRGRSDIENVVVLGIDVTPPTLPKR